MIVLNILGSISPICISKKLGLWISNLPNDESNNWNEHLCFELKTCLHRASAAKGVSGTKTHDNYLKMYEQVFPHTALSEEERIQAIVNRMICIYFDYEYEDMPMGDWTTNCFDGRFCEGDYAEKVVDFFNFVSNGRDERLPSLIPQWIYSSNYNEECKYRLLWGGNEAEPYIGSLIKMGELIDGFLLNRNDYLLLDYLMNSIHKDNEYNEIHLLKAYSLCQLFLEKEKEAELDYKLPFFIEKYPTEKKAECAVQLRKLRNKLAHGDFIAFENAVETFASSLMDEYFWFDHSEYSRKNWAILHACCMLDDAVRKLIQTMLLDRDYLNEIKSSKLPAANSGGSRPARDN